MTPVTIFERKTRDGRAVVGSIERTMGMTSLVVTLAGKRVFAGAPGIITVQVRQQNGIPSEYTHIAGVPILASEYAAYQAAADATSEPVDLGAQRRQLVADYNALCEAQEDAYNRAHDRGDARAGTIRDAYEARIDAARQAVIDFDAAHPEVMAQIGIERADGVARALRGED